MSWAAFGGELFGIAGKNTRSGLRLALSAVAAAGRVSGVAGERPVAGALRSRLTAFLGRQGRQWKGSSSAVLFVGFVGARGVAGAVVPRAGTKLHVAL